MLVRSSYGMRQRYIGLRLSQRRGVHYKSINYFINVITITAPAVYPNAEANAIFHLSLQVLESTIYPTNGKPKNGAMNAKNIIPNGFSAATLRI